MAEKDWGTRLQNNANSNNSNRANNTESNNSNRANNAESNNIVGPKFGTQSVNESCKPTNDGYTRYEIAEKNKKNNEKE